MSNELPTDRPMVSVAVICEKVLRETDGTLSAIRMVDQFNVPPIPPTVDLERAIIQANALVCFKSGPFEGTFDVTFRVRRPSGAITALEHKFPAAFTGGVSGVNFMVAFGLKATERGLHFFEAMRDQQVLACIPFTLVDTPAASSGDSQADSKPF